MATHEGPAFYGFGAAELLGAAAPVSMTMAHEARAYCGQIAHFLRSNPGAWTQGTAARNSEGLPVNIRSPFARSWCAIALVERFVHKPEVSRMCASLLARAVSPPRIPISAISYNDSPHRKVEEVVQMFEAASHLPELAELDFANFGMPVPSITSLQESYLNQQDQQDTIVSMPFWKPLFSPGSGDNDINPLKPAWVHPPANNHPLVPWEQIMQQIKEDAVA